MMSSAPIPPVLAQLLENLDAAGPEGLARRQEELLALQADMKAVLEAKHEGSSDDGRLSVSMDASGVLHDVVVDGSLTMRPSSTGLAQAFKDAVEHAIKTAAEKSREAFEKQFGIKTPADEDAVDAARESRRSMEEQLAQVPDPAVAKALRGMMERADEFAARTFEGRSGPVLLTLNAAGVLVDVVLDRIALQGVDNLTLGDDFKAAWQHAIQSLEQAKREVALVSLGAEFDPAHAQAQLDASMEEAERHISALSQMQLPRL